MRQCHTKCLYEYKGKTIEATEQNEGLGTGPHSGAKLLKSLSQGENTPG